MRIVINTPAGNIGRVVTTELLDAGERVVIISRHPHKVADFVARGARLVEGSIDDPAVLDRALEGADALFWLTPFVPRADYLAWAPAIAAMAGDALRRHRVPRVVLISSVGAQQPAGLGPVSVLPAVESAFRDAAPHVIALRAGHFMENFLANVHTIATTGTIYSPLPASRPLPIVATRDIGQRAALLLRDTQWRGFRTVGVHGPEDLDPDRAAALIGEGIGRAVRYVEVSVEDARRGMLDAGLPPSMVDLLCEMYSGLRAGLMERAEPRSADTTTPTSLRDFAREVLRPAVAAASTAAA